MTPILPPFPYAELSGSRRRSSVEFTDSQKDTAGARPPEYLTDGILPADRVQIFAGAAGQAREVPMTPIARKHPDQVDVMIDFNCPDCTGDARSIRLGPLEITPAVREIRCPLCGRWLFALTWRSGPAPSHEAP